MILITRPREDALKMAAMLEAKGCKCLIQPMAKIEYRGFVPRKYSAYITTSKHAKKFVPQNGNLISIPERGRTAKEVFEWIISNRRPKDGEMIYLRGKDITLDLTLELHAKGFDCDEAVVYEAKAVEKLDVDLNKVTLATFFSVQTLLNFVKLTDERMPVLVLSEKIAGIAKENGFKNIQVAPEPNLAALINRISPP